MHNFFLPTLMDHFLYDLKSESDWESWLYLLLLFWCIRVKPEAEGYFFGTCEADDVIVTFLPSCTTLMTETGLHGKCESRRKISKRICFICLCTSKITQRTFQGKMAGQSQAAALLKSCDTACKRISEDKIWSYKENDRSHLSQPRITCPACWVILPAWAPHVQRHCRAQATRLCLFEEKPSVWWYIHLGCSELPEVPPVRSDDVMQLGLITNSAVLCAHSSVIASQARVDATTYVCDICAQKLSRYCCGPTGI